jgi:hypothetical protein
MTVPSLTDVFGPAATQTATTITIAKADFPTLTASTTNNGQQLFAALLLKAAAKLSSANRTNDPDVKIEISYTGQTIFPVTGSDNLDRQDSYSIVLHKQVAKADVDPDDY